MHSTFAKQMGQTGPAIITGRSTSGPAVTDLRPSMTETTGAFGATCDTSCDDTPTTLKFGPGTTLIDRYQIIGQIGRGGMSVVYEAVDQVRGDHVAVKVLLPHVAASEKSQDRFLQEGRLSSQFSHPGIARVYDLHQTDDFVLLSMELLRGSTLRQEMVRRSNQRQPFSPMETLQTISSLAEALAVVHEAGVIHRDLKPENIWVGLDGSLKVMDFGIARDQQGRSFTTSGWGSGTPYYIAPEQLSASPNLDHRADQYALAVIAFEMLTGEIPQGAVVPPRVRNPEIPKRLSNAIFRALNADPSERFANVDHFQKAARFETKTSPWSRIAQGVAGAVAIIVAIIVLTRFIVPSFTPAEVPVWNDVRDLTVSEGQELRFDVASDELAQSDQRYAFRLFDDAPDGASIDASSGMITWTPGEFQGPASHTFTVAAMVGEDQSSLRVSERDFTVEVLETIDPPQFATPSAQTTREHQLMQLDLKVVDPNDPQVPLRFELDNAPSGMRVDPDGVLTFQANERQGGNVYQVPVRAIVDLPQAGPSVAIERTVTVMVEESIDPPTFTSPQRVEVTAGEPLRYQATFYDSNHPMLGAYYRIGRGRRDVAINPQTGVIDWTPENSLGGREIELAIECCLDVASQTRVLSSHELTVRVQENPDNESTQNENTATTNGSSVLSRLIEPTTRTIDLLAPGPETHSVVDRTNGMNLGNRGGGGTCPSNHGPPSRSQTGRGTATNNGRQPQGDCRGRSGRQSAAGIPTSLESLSRGTSPVELRGRGRSTRINNQPRVRNAGTIGRAPSTCSSGSCK